jgi:hypothetical protein
MAIDDRPRKKKKKKQSNLALWIGLGVGGVVVLILIVVLIVVVAVGAFSQPLAKVKLPDPPKLEAKQEPPPGPDNGPPQKKGAGGIGRSREVAEVRNVLKQLGLAYHSFDSTESRAPNSRKDLGPYYENNGRINEVLDKGEIVFLYGVRPLQMAQGTSNTILAYENIPDQAGIRIVLMGDGSVDQMDEATFRKAPKAGKAK